MNQVMRIVEEHYLRDDLGLGSLHGLTTLGSPHELLALLEQHSVEGEKGMYVRFGCTYVCIYRRRLVSRFRSVVRAYIRGQAVVWVF